MSLRLLIALSSVAWPAAADRGVTVEVDTPALRADELERAIRVRVPADGPALHVRITPTAAGLLVDVHGGTREVRIAGLSADAALRLVALTATDLALDDLAAPPPSAGRMWTLALVGGAISWEQPLGGISGDVAVAWGSARRSRLLALEVGTARLLGGELELDATTVRVGPGLRTGVVEVRAGLVLAPISVADGTGDRTVLAGAGASVRARLPIAAHVRAVFALGADAFATQSVYREAGMTVLTTPRVAPYLAVGLEIAP